MIYVRKASERGYADHGWLKAYHSFSFADYYDPQFMGFSALRVINDDWVAGGNGFPMHPHQDMEIVTYVLEGALEHKDSMGNGSIIRAGEIQHMSAGTGVTHSEFNPSKSETYHGLQIWMLPKSKGITPTYDQKPVAFTDGLTLIAGPEPAPGAVTIHQDARLYAARLKAGVSVAHSLAAGRKAWVQMALGAAELNGIKIAQGDGVAMAEETTVTLTGGPEGAEVLVFDLP